MSSSTKTVIEQVMAKEMQKKKEKEKQKKIVIVGYMWMACASCSP